MSKRTTFTRTLETVSGSKSLTKAAKGMSVVRLVYVPDKRKKQSCELCGTRFQRGAWVSFSKSKSRLLIGGNCLVSLSEGHFSSNYRQGVVKREVSSFLRKIYSAEADPKSWLSWLVENATEEIAHDVALISFVGKAASWERLAKLVRYHDENRLFLTEALFSPYTFLPAILDLPATMTIARHDVICAQYSRGINVSLAAKITEEYARSCDLITESRLTTKKSRRVAAAIHMATEARNMDESLAIELSSRDKWTSAHSAKRGDLIWNPKLGIAKFLNGDSQFGELEAPQIGKGSKSFSLAYWYLLNPTTKRSEEDIYRKAVRLLFGMLALGASERSQEIDSKR